MKYTIIRDQQEKSNYWEFAPSDYFEGTTVQHLKTGDYTIAGMEDKISLERKGTLKEFAANLFQKRFYRELDRLEQFRYSFILLDFSLSDLLDYPNSCNLPPQVKRRIRANGYVLLKKLIEIQLKYKVKILFCDGKGKKVASSIFKRVIEHEQKNSKA